MIQFIIGEKGKGKTKVLLEKANAQIKEANGNIVYLDKSAQHMYELNNRIRLIDVLKIAKIPAPEEAKGVLDQLNAIGEQFKVNFVVSISVTKEQLPETYYDGIIAEL